MKQCPTCGHRTNDDVCPVCGEVTVVLQNDPQEKAQRTIQYQRFDPAKTPGKTTGGHAAPAENRFTQKDPGAAHHMQRGSGATPPPHPAKAAPQPVPQSQSAAPTQPTTGDSRDTSYQHTEEFRPSTLPRRSQKYRQRYASYLQSDPESNAVQSSRSQNTGASNAQQTPATQGAQIPSTAQAAQPPHAPVPQEPQAAQPPHATQNPLEKQESQAAQESPRTQEPQGLPETLNQKTEPAAQTTLEPQTDSISPQQETTAPVAPAVSAFQQQAAPQGHETPADPVISPIPSTPEAQELPTGSEELHLKNSPETPVIEENEATPHGVLSPEELETFLDIRSDDAEDDVLPESLEENAAISTEPGTSDKPDAPDEPVYASRSDENDKNDVPEDEHLPTRQELIRKRNEQIRRENNRRYAEEHASRAARRWQEESEDEPFAIVRGTCYYSALESETTVRGNFSKKRYKDDVLPQSEPVSYEDSEWYQGFDSADDPWGDYVEPDEKKKGVSHKAWFVILLLIIFWPAGLILMWVRRKFPLAVRIIITLIIASGLAFEGYFLYNYGPAMYEQYMYGDSNNITYETPGSGDSGSRSGSQTSVATESQQKALDKANEYVNTLALSHDGLVRQLEYDGYSTDDATYAADNCSTNWNKEAREMAEQYMESTTYTYDAMVQQLEAEGFTRSQAEFGAKAVGLE